MSRIKKELQKYRLLLHVIVAYNCFCCSTSEDSDALVVLDVGDMMSYSNSRVSVEGNQAM